MTDRDLAEASEPDSRGYRIPGENLNFNRTYFCSRCQVTDLIWKFKDYNAETKKAKWCLHTLAGVAHRCNAVPASTNAPRVPQQPTAPLQAPARAVREPDPLIGGSYGNRQSNGLASGGGRRSRRYASNYSHLPIPAPQTIPIAKPEDPPSEFRALRL